MARIHYRHSRTSQSLALGRIALPSDGAMENPLFSEDALKHIRSAASNLPQRLATKRQELIIAALRPDPNDPQSVAHQSVGVRYGGGQIEIDISSEVRGQHVEVAYERSRIVIASPHANSTTMRIHSTGVTIITCGTIRSMSQTTGYTHDVEDDHNERDHLEDEDGRGDWFELEGMEHQERISEDVREDEVTVSI